MLKNITINQFEGPLDLLLSLIKKEEMNIFDINITSITNQYLAYITKMKKLNLNIDSEYLVLATELIEIKARELLPHNDQYQEEENPKEELINRLIEYKQYKEVIRQFEELKNQRKELFVKNPSFLDEYKSKGINLENDITLNDLIETFTKFNERKQFEKPLNTVITTKEYSVKKRSEEILNQLKTKTQIDFHELFNKPIKAHIVVTFLSILDLAKKQCIILNQDKYLDKIIIKRRIT